MKMQHFEMESTVFERKWFLLHSFVKKSFFTFFYSYFYSYFGVYLPVCNRQHGTFLYGRTHISILCIKFRKQYTFVECENGHSSEASVVFIWKENGFLHLLQTIFYILSATKKISYSTQNIRKSDKKKSVAKLHCHTSGVI